jgi:hypothetical protein
MNASIVAAIIAGSVAALGWAASSTFTAIANIRVLRVNARLQHVEKQLEKLYGPLVFLILEGEQTFRELLLALKRNYVFDKNNNIPKDDLETWLFWAENDFMPRNEKIKELLSQQTHLLYDSRMVDSYRQFLMHHNSWSIRHLRWKKEGIPYSWHSGTNWPRQFGEDVLNAYAKLEDEHKRLLAKR